MFGPIKIFSSYHYVPNLKIKVSFKTFVLKNIDYVLTVISFSFSVVEGWPPDKSRNLSDYLKPHTNTTLIRPNLPFLEQMSWKGQNYSKTHILICVHSAVNSSERRNLIRRTWAKEQKNLPTKVIFLIGISKGVF